jgi:hypothetical protein
MSLIGSTTVSKIAQSVRICLVLLGAVCPSIAFGQSDARRPVRQIETDDGVIEITNSQERAGDTTLTEEVTSVRALRATDRREAESGANDASGPSAALASTLAAAPASKAFSSWWLPLIVVVVAGAVCVWGFRRRRSLRRSMVVAPSAAAIRAMKRSDTLDEAEDVLTESELDADVLEEAGAFAGQWVDAVRDSVPPSSPPRSSRSANAPRQWLSQPVRPKPDES